MALKELYIGPRTKEVFVPAPVQGGDFSSVGWSGGMQFINGGYGARTSRATHKEYNMSWSLNKRDELRPITDMYDGVMGPGPIYFIDPFAADKNLLPQNWAFPALGAYDGIPLVADTRPDIVATGSNTRGRPAESALIKFTSSTVRQYLYIPIPTGYTAWVGQHGTASGTNGLRVRPVYRNNTTAAAEIIPVISITSSTRVSEQYSSADYAGIELYVNGTAGTSMVLTDMMVQVHPTGSAAPLGGFISGQGNSGCAFEKAPTVTAYSAAIDRIGMAAKLIEVGSWL